MYFCKKTEDMERKIIKDLLVWKDKNNRKPLIILGARQVGKTWIMRQFGEQYFESVAYVNCDAEPLAQEMFQADYDIRRILMVVQAITGVKVEAGRTLLIFDELQEAPRGLHSLKYFQENAPEYHVIAAGSLLGITLTQQSSFPVGKVDLLHLYPMDYEEFLAANNGENLFALLRDTDWKSLGILTSKYIQQLREYYFVGGMPEAVQEYTEHHDLTEVRQIQQNILDAYRNDISKHSTKTESIRIGQVLDSLPSQLAKENKKFIYGMVKQGARAKDFELAIQWLIDAGIVHKVSRVREIHSPLKFYEDPSAFKLFLLDCGLLGCMADAPAKAIIAGDSIFKEYKGAFTEQYVLQQLTANNKSVYYWSNDKTPSEIDFVTQEKERVIPIEVKAEENVRARSLKTYIDTHPDYQLKGLRISMKEYIDQEWMENIPLFAIQRYFQ